MYHSITFGDKNTWDDWHIIPTAKPYVESPAPKLKIVTIPGRSMPLDLTNAMAPYPTFSPRQGEFSFIVPNEYYDPSLDRIVQRENWETTYQKMKTHLHGKVMRMVFVDDDPNYYYEGRFTLSDWSGGKEFYSVKISYIVQPLKVSLIKPGDEWEWDPFDFEFGIIQDYSTVVLDGSVKTVTIEWMGTPAIPVFSTDTVLQSLAITNSSGGTVNVPLTYWDWKQDGAADIRLQFSKPLASDSNVSFMQSWTTEAGSIGKIPAGSTSYVFHNITTNKEPSFIRITNVPASTDITMTIFKSSTVTLSFNGRTYTINGSRFRDPDIVIRSGINSLEFTGTGAVQIDLKEERL